MNPIIIMSIFMLAVVALFCLGVYLGMTFKDDKWKSILLKDIKSTKSKKWTAVITIDVSEKEPIITVATGSTKPTKGQALTEGSGFPDSFFIKMLEKFIKTSTMGWFLFVI